MTKNVISAENPTGDTDSVLSVADAIGQMLVVSPTSTVNTQSNYVFTFYAKSISGTRILANALGTPRGFDLTAGEWTRCEIDVDADSDQGITSHDVKIMFTDNTEVYLYELMLQRGSSATDWTEAPEDANEYADEKVEKYIVDISNGVKIKNALDESYYVTLTSDGMGVFADDTQVAQFGSETWLGRENNKGISFDTSGNVTLGSGASISWNNVTDQPTIPTDVDDLTDTKGEKWSTAVGEDFIKTTSVTAQNLLTNKLLVKNSDSKVLIDAGNSSSTAVTIGGFAIDENLFSSSNTSEGAGTGRYSEYSEGIITKKTIKIDSSTPVITLVNDEQIDASVITGDGTTGINSTLNVKDGGINATYTEQTGLGPYVTYTDLEYGEISVYSEESNIGELQHKSLITSTDISVSTESEVETSSNGSSEMSSAGFSTTGAVYASKGITSGADANISGEVICSGISTSGTTYPKVTMPISSAGSPYIRWKLDDGTYKQLIISTGYITYQTSTDGTNWTTVWKK